MLITVRLTLQFTDCSRTSGFKSSLKQVHLKIYQAVGLTKLSNSKGHHGLFPPERKLYFNNNEKAVQAPRNPAGIAAATR
jgi:hypothetical protein